MIARSRISTVLKRDGTEAPFDQKRIATAIYKAAASIGGRDQELADQLAGEIMGDLVKDSAGGPPSVEDIQDLVERVLIRNGHAKTAKAYILYRHRRDVVRKGDIGRQQSGAVETIPWKLLWRTLAWNADHDCDNIEGLNRWVTGGNLQELMRGADAQYDRQLDYGADEFLDKAENVRLFIVAGPSSSGKTTTTYKLAQRLKKAGLELVALNLDNYFRDLELHPKDEYDDYDYETPEALDLPLINEHLERLIAGDEIMMPRYDFHTGKQILAQTPVRVKKNQIIFIDTLHGLSDVLTETVPDEMKFKLYIETFCQLRPLHGRFVRWTDVRLLRRTVRDANFRNHDPALTLGHWHYVRSSEIKHIIPYLHTVDLTVNGSLPYELPVLKKHVWSYFPDLVEKFKKQPERQDANIRASRVKELLDQVEIMSDEDEAKIAGDSLLREFIGGSTIEY